jgi:hypothetical protein
MDDRDDIIYNTTVGNLSKSWKLFWECIIILSLEKG